MIYASKQFQQRRSYLEEVARSFRQRNPERYYYYRLLTQRQLREPASPWHRFRLGPGYTLFMLTHGEDIQRLVNNNPGHWLEKQDVVDC